jgi:hypothetical protein
MSRALQRVWRTSQNRLRARPSRCYSTRGAQANSSQGGSGSGVGTRAEAWGAAACRGQLAGFVSRSSEARHGLLRHVPTHTAGQFLPSFTRKRQRIRRATRLELGEWKPVKLDPRSSSILRSYIWLPPRCFCFNPNLTPRLGGGSWERRRSSVGPSAAWTVSGE